MQVICPERKRGGAHCQNAISYTPLSYLKLLINDECTDEEGLTRISVVLWLRWKPWSTKCELLLANIWRLQKWLHRERATKLTNLNVAERQLAGPQQHQTTEKAKPSQLAKWHEREDAEKFDLKHISCPCFLTEHEGSQEHGGLRVSHLHPDGVPSFSEIWGCIRAAGAWFINLLHYRFLLVE